MQLLFYFKDEDRVACFPLGVRERLTANPQGGATARSRFADSLCMWRC
ncbi:hypothetical protein I8748_32520 [Nostoc sp. CENA67]|uniref:Uncharacterized protein n=1 Tax=Amazonocrinis nigriterrae CENA67 TaxID=2794033 RepID=A0A8J7HYZ9_9NOST|nr:hypothetical protein [Amazonocrinis nigriterrae]MBH8566820.1 hypothetical protein [Amazonocrinis nigriterrae CENA67]